jgi:hypothetical protein
VTTAAPSTTKFNTGTNQVHTAVCGSPALECVAIGEVVTYTLTVRVPEGTTPNAVILLANHKRRPFFDITADAEIEVLIRIANVAIEAELRKATKTK